MRAASGRPRRPAAAGKQLSLAARLENLERTLADIEGPVVLVAHSAGNLITAHGQLANRRENVKGALLAAPVDIETPLPVGPTMDELRAMGWLPAPKQPLSFPSIVAASANDKVCSPESVKALAQAWGSKLVELGDVGHLSPADGYGTWPCPEVHRRAVLILSRAAGMQAFR